MMIIEVREAMVVAGKMVLPLSNERKDKNPQRKWNLVWMV
jgi:hypothetical protein